MKIAVASKPGSKSDALALGIKEQLQDLGHNICSPFEDGIDLNIAVGGDGSVLRALHRSLPHKIPVLGIYAGTLGYMTVTEGEWIEIFQSWVQGDIKPQKRITLTYNSEVLELNAINEFVIEKPEPGQMVSLEVWVDDFLFHTYYCDGLIIATPTGSTAYSMSVRGPIMDPCHEAIIITPIAPHGLFDRSLVLSPDAVIRIVPRDITVLISYDGIPSHRIRPDNSVSIKKGEIKARVLGKNGTHFTQVVRNKFGGF